MTAPASPVAITYLGVREGLRNALARHTVTDRTNPLQVVDLVGSGAPGVRQLVRQLKPDAPTVVLSIRRTNLDDATGDIENTLLTNVPNAVILRLAPLDLSIPLLWAWARPTGVLMSSFQPGGTSWIRTSDLAEALARLDQDGVDPRAGRAYDVTGPQPVSMEALAGLMTTELGISVALDLRTPPDFVDVMTANGLPIGMASWIAQYQWITSDPDLEPTTPVLGALLDREPRPAVLVPSNAGPTL